MWWYRGQRVEVDKKEVLG